MKTNLDFKKVVLNILEFLLWIFLWVELFFVVVLILSSFVEEESNTVPGKINRTRHVKKAVTVEDPGLIAAKAWTYFRFDE